MAAATTEGSSAEQGPLWGAAADDWAAIQEPTGRPLFQAVLARGHFADRTRALDVGCGAGLFAELAAWRGATVTGLDAAEPLLALARRRVPRAAFHRGDMEALPFAADSFDVVTGINAFQFAADPGRALGEARRVARRGAAIVVATWGPPDYCEAAAYLGALKALGPPAAPNAPGPFALSDEQRLRAFVESADLIPARAEDVDVPFAYADLETAIKGLLSAGPAVRAIQASGRARVREAVERAIAPYRQSSGSYLLENRFRYLIATRA